jgi:hypothetical protein
MSWWWQVDVRLLSKSESLAPLAIIIVPFLIWLNVKTRRRDVDKQ